MSNPYADDFLNSVIKRSESDSIIGVGNLMLVLVVAPFLVVLGLIIRQMSYNVEPYFEDYLTLELIMEIICAFVIFRILDSVNKHRKRDREWGKALVGYASYIGHDTKTLENAVSELSIDALNRITKAAKFVFFALLVINIIVGSLLFAIVLSSDVVQRYNIYMSLAIYIYLTVACVFIYREVERHNATQIRFSEMFSEIMADDLPMIPPMATGVKERDLKLHAVAVILTLGLYAPFFLAFTVHAIKGHITYQWAYEEKLLEAIAKKEDAVDVELVGKKGLVQKYIRRK